MVLELLGLLEVEVLALLFLEPLRAQERFRVLELSDHLVLVVDPLDYGVHGV